ncbi:MAG: type III pantothenate kinase [Oscillospiraceae bacterium]|nr:type III pantothenate kinase [Oscillospiraceae bacterium]
MLLAVDAGNTHIVLGCMEGGSLLFTARVSTDRNKTADEYALVFRNLCELHGVDRHSAEGAVIASVVSELTDVLRAAVEKIIHKTPIMVGAGIKTGVNIKIDDPGQLGADLVVGAVAATAKYPKPLIIFDLGTADTMSVIDGDGRFLGGAIMAGPRLSVDALASRTSQLPRIHLDVPGKVVCGNTVAAMQSGAIYGHAAMLDGLIDRVETELGQPMAAVVATGGLSPLVIPLCRREIHVEENLMLQGLKLIYDKNK